jgi:alpha-L-rhamnosidase
MKFLLPLRHLVLLLVLGAHHALAMNVTGLRCDGQTAPLGASQSPTLTWRITTEERNQRQTAWRILVASSAELLANDKGDLWDSGKTTATRSPQIRYSGKPLKAGTTCHWKVRCWDATDKASSWSDPSTFEIAPSAPADWQGARWIDDGKPLPEKDEDFYQEDPAPLLRREFNITKPVTRARLHVAGLGYAYPSLNGARVADHALDPPWTNFDKRILYRTHDVTKQLAEGANCIGLTLGNGWYNPLPLRMWGGRNIRDSLPTGRPRAIALLVVDHPDGTRTTVTTGDGWTTTEGPTLRNSIYLGEVRDARKTLPGWDKAGFKAASWKPARVTDAPLDPLQPLAMPPVRTLNPVKAVAVTTPSPDVHIVDFGLNLTAIPEIKLDVPAGTRVLLRFGEILHDDGTLNPMTSVCGQIKGKRKGKDGNEAPIGGPGSPEIAWQQDVYIAKGGGPETYRPDFTFHSFRYMEVSGVPKAPIPGDCMVFPMFTNLADGGSFSCSNDRLNHIQEITRRTFLNNVVTVQSDCPHRERFGYGGDIVATSEAFLMNYDMAGFYAKTVRDWADGARPDGNFTDTAPFVGIQYCGVGWAMVHPLLIEQLYQHYGNKALIGEQLPAATRWFELEASKRENGLVVKGLGDHESMPKKAGPVITTPMFIDTARRMARLARIGGKEQDAARFANMAGESAGAWATEFLDEKTGKVGGGSQSEQVLAIAWGTLLPPARNSAFDFLVADLTNKPDGPSLTTGIFGTRMLLEELSKNNRHDLACALADRKEFPSWGHMLDHGATTLWETWKESDNTFSHNHPMFGSISAWFFRWLGGIQCAEDAVGFDRIVIRPQVTQGLTWVKSSHDTVRGRIESNWKITDKGTEFDIVIPPDTEAEIELPSGTITESGKPLSQAAGITVLKSSLNRMKAGSGRYQFTISLK